MRVTANKVSNTKTLALIGGGRVAKSLARLWVDQAQLTIGDVLNRSVSSAQRAVDFIGQGRAVATINGLTLADFILMACPDDQLAVCVQQLAAQQHDLSQVTVFHCSGALSSKQLMPLAEQGAMIASVHPVKSFSDPEQVIQSFQGVFCGIEGQVEALQRLEPLFEAIGATTFELRAADKILYHAASVMACNYLVSLEALSLQLFQQVGLEREQALAIMQPLVVGTVQQIFQVGPELALTGPIARGDVKLVAQQLADLTECNSNWGTLYRLLGAEALALRNRHPTQAKLATDIQQSLQALLQEPS